MFSFMFLSVKVNAPETVQYGLVMHTSRARSLKQGGRDHSPVDEAASCRAVWHVRCIVHVAFVVVH